MRQQAAPAILCCVPVPQIAESQSKTRDFNASHNTGAVGVNVHCDLELNHWQLAGKQKLLLDGHRQSPTHVRREKSWQRHHAQLAAAP